MTEINERPAAEWRRLTYQQGYARIPAQVSAGSGGFRLDSIGGWAKVVSCFGLSGLKYGNPAGSNRRGLPHLGHGNSPSAAA